MYNISNALKGNLKSLMGDAFSNEEFERGLRALASLININDEKSNFDIDYGNLLNESNITSSSWDIISGCRIEGMLRKIENLKGHTTEDAMLQAYYTRIGFYRMLDDPQVKAARVNDTINASNADNIRGKEGFHLAEANAEAYKECPYFIYDYIVVYQLRNRIKAHDNPETFDFIEKMERIKSLFIVYMDQCIKNYDLICDYYEKEFIENNIDYVTFAQRYMPNSDELNEFLSKFLQLNWKDDENQTFEYDYTKSIKFIGEAGTGKTTQMRRMYIELLKDIISGKTKKLPVWIELKNIVEETASIEGILNLTLKEYEHQYDLLFKNSVLVLFLDGYNEILEENIKRKIAHEIDNVHKSFPETLIVMTDRSKKSNPPCLQRNVLSYTINSLTREEIKEYIRLQCDDECCKKIFDYMDNEEWLDNINMIPTKINNTIYMFKDNIKPHSEDEFYDAYLKYILDREADEKKETRIEDLKFCLGELTSAMNSPRDDKTRHEIIKLWAPLFNNNSHIAQELFQLAIELPILKPSNNNDNSYMFVHPQYFVMFEEGF